MKLLSNLPIALKLLVAIALLAVISTAIAGGAIMELRGLNKLTQKVAHDDARSLYLASTSNERMTRAHQLTIELILANEPAEIAAIERRVDDQIRELQKLMGELKPFMAGPEEQRAFGEATIALDGYLGMAAKVRAAARSNDDAQAQELLRTISPMFIRVDDALRRLVEQQSDDLMRAAEAADARFWLVARTMVVVTALGLAAALALSLLMIRFQVTAPLRAMTELMQALAGGDLERAVLGVTRRDEIGAMARSVEVFKRNAIKVHAFDLEREQVAQHAAEERRAILTSLASGFEASVKRVVEAVVDSAGRMQVTASSLAEAVRETTGRTTAADAAAQDAADNVGTVAMATDELRNSIEEIAKRADDSRRIARQATQQAEETVALVGKLDAAS
ncbi:MAG: MCP four helix bundle domain-containing protein, partial [Alphaproteobacteria bacterium]|nr:MCP four helix bundle domain-containing protein [Alphaproteobacteria bacterium]